MRVKRRPQPARAYKPYLDVVWDLFYPQRCAGCDARASDILCRACYEDLPLISGERCARCGLPTAFDTPVCEGCKNVDYAFDSATAPLRYEGVGGSLVRALKYGGEFAVARKVMAPLMVESLAERRYEHVVAAPMRPSRRRKRGFNQAEVLARGVSSITGAGFLDGMKTVRVVRDQVELSAGGRRENVRGAFRFDGRVGGNVLLVDDVFTTGATMSECASELLLAGAEEVHAVSFCKTC